MKDAQTQDTRRTAVGTTSYEREEQLLKQQEGFSHAFIAIGWLMTLVASIMIGFAISSIGIDSPLPALSGIVLSICSLVAAGEYALADVKQDMANKPHLYWGNLDGVDNALGEWFRKRQLLFTLTTTGGLIWAAIANSDPNTTTDVPALGQVRGLGGTIPSWTYLLPIGFGIFGFGFLLMVYFGKSRRIAIKQWVWKYDPTALTAADDARIEARRWRTEKLRHEFAGRLVSEVGASAVITGWQDEHSYGERGCTEVQLRRFQEYTGVTQHTTSHYGNPVKIQSNGQRFMVPAAVQPDADKKWQVSPAVHTVMLGGTGKGKSVMLSQVAAAALRNNQRVVMLLLKGSDNGETTAQMMSDILTEYPDISSSVYSWPHTPIQAPKWDLLRGLRNANNPEEFIRLVMDLANQTEGATGGSAYFAQLVRTYATHLYYFKDCLGNGGMQSMKFMLDAKTFSSMIFSEMRKRNAEGTQTDEWVERAKETRRWLKDEFIDNKEQNKDISSAKNALASTITVLAEAFPNVSWTASNSEYWDSNNRLTIIEAPAGAPQLASFLVSDLALWCEHKTEATGPVTVIIDEIGSMATDPRGEVGRTAAGEALARGFMQWRSKGIELWAVGQDESSFGYQTIASYVGAGASLITMGTSSPWVSDYIVKSVQTRGVYASTTNNNGAHSVGVNNITGIDPNTVMGLGIGEFLAVGGGRWVTGAVVYQGRNETFEADLIRSMQTYGLHASNIHGFLHTMDHNNQVRRNKRKQFEIIWCGNTACMSQQWPGDDTMPCRRCGETNWHHQWRFEDAKEIAWQSNTLAEIVLARRTANEAVQIAQAHTQIDRASKTGVVNEPLLDASQLPEPSSGVVEATEMEWGDHSTGREHGEPSPENSEES